MSIVPFLGRNSWGAPKLAVTPQTCRKVCRFLGSRGFFRWFRRLSRWSQSWISTDQKYDSYTSKNCVHCPDQNFTDFNSTYLGGRHGNRWCIDLQLHQGVKGLWNCKGWNRGSLTPSLRKFTIVYVISQHLLFSACSCLYTLCQFEMAVGSPTISTKVVCLRWKCPMSLMFMFAGRRSNSEEWEQSIFSYCGPSTTKIAKPLVHLKPKQETQQKEPPQIGPLLGPSKIGPKNHKKKLEIPASDRHPTPGTASAWQHLPSLHQNPGLTRRARQTHGGWNRPRVGPAAGS